MTTYLSSVFLCMLLSCWSSVLAQNSGFYNGDNQAAPENESWLKQNKRYIFVIVLGVIALALFIWYVVKSIKSMRKRLALENEKQMQMIQQITEGSHYNTSETTPISTGDHVYKGSSQVVTPPMTTPTSDHPPRY